MEPMKLTELIPVQVSSLECFGLVPLEAVQILQEIMEYGHFKGKDGWWKMSRREHLTHAHRHLLLAMYDPNTGAQPLVPSPDAEPHLKHAFCRHMMALMVEHGYKPKPYVGLKLSEMADMVVPMRVIYAQAQGDGNDHQADVPERSPVPDQPGADPVQEGERAGVAGCR